MSPRANRCQPDTLSAPPPRHLDTPVPPLDAGFYFIDTPTTPQTIASFGVLEGAPDPVMLRRDFERLLGLFPRLMDCISDRGALFWSRDSEFSLGNHLQFINAPSGEPLEHTLSRLFSAPLPRDRPPWQFLVLNSGAFLFKLHHTLADGVGGLALLNALFTGEERARSAGKIEERPSFLRLLPSLLSLVAAQLRPVAKTPVKGANSARRELLFFDLPASELRALKRRYSVSINDLFLSLSCRAVRRVHQQRGMPLGQLRVIMPASTRPLSERHSLGNQLIAVNLLLPFDTESGAEQIRLVHRITSRFKSGALLSSFECLAHLGSHLPRFLQRPVGEFFLSRSSFICTNMPLPRTPGRLGGALIRSQYGVPALLRSQGIGFSLMTYGERACFSLVSDPQIIPDATEIKRAFIGEFHALTALSPVDRGQS